MELSVASYNLWLNKAYPEVSTLAADMKPDILCLQECKPNAMLERLGRLHLAGSRAYVNGVAIEKPLSLSSKIDWFWKNGGMAVYYAPDKLELIDITSHRLTLPWSERKGGRFVQLARFKTSDGHELSVINIHLSALWSTNRSRRKQLADGVSHLAKDSPALMAGDFNYPLGSRGLRSFMAGSGMHECGVHMPKRTHTSKLIRGKFDHIFITDDLSETDYAVLPFSKSDHAPVMATIQFK